MTPHFHSIEDGCELENRLKVKKPDNYGKNCLNHKFCKTHNVEICNCGWEFGFHYGIYIKKNYPEYGRLAKKLLYQTQ